MFEKLFGSSEQSTLVASAFEQFSAMLKESAAMYDIGVAALFENQTINVDLEAMDTKIDEGEREIRRMMLEHLAVNPGTELVTSLQLLSVVQDAERLGDCALGLQNLVRLAKDPRSGEFAEELHGIAQRIRPQFDATDTAFCGDDADTARSVIANHVEISQELRAFTEHVAGSDLQADQALVYADAERILSRVSAHLSNIASAVSEPFDRIRADDEDA